MVVPIIENTNCSIEKIDIVTWWNFIYQNSKTILMCWTQKIEEWWEYITPTDGFALTLAAFLMILFVVIIWLTNA